VSSIYLVDSREVPFEKNPGGTTRRLLLKAKNQGPYASISGNAAGNTIHAHYHPIDQFQVILEGSATYPDHTLGPLDVHYTDARTAYGPFTPGPDGLTQSILQRRGVGIVWMDQPGKKPDSKGRQLFALMSGAEWEELGRGLRKKVTLGKDGRGPKVEVSEGKEGAVIETGPSGFGEFVLFVSGRFKTSDREILAYAVRFAEGSDKSPPITFASDGARILVATYDRPMLPRASVSR
jgi:hypothetical protein